MERARTIECDVLVVGGGINGAGIARDAAGRGMSVVLCEKDDLGSHTSSASTKLIHGGLRYLEYYEFGLVRKALIEREVLLREAPHIMWPLRFVMPHDEGQRPAWMIRAGLLLYDCLARRELLPGSGTIDLRKHPAGAPLKADFTRGFVYSDGWVDDARLVLLNAIDAAERGATVLVRTACEAVERQGDRWRARLRGTSGTTQLSARYVVNATGPWATHFLESAASHPADRKLRLIKGSHIIVRRLFEHPFAYIFQNPDGRIGFAIPFQREFTLVGTTDLEFHGSADQVAIEADEIDYLCKLVSRYFRQPVTPQDVVWSYSGVRPLVEDESSSASAVTRDYRFELDEQGAPMLSILGGKITTFRKLAEEAVDLIARALGNGHGHWTEGACLPGGDLFGPRPSNRAVREFDRYLQEQQRQYAWLPGELVARYVRSYGTRIALLLAGRATLEDMGQEVAPGLYAAELEYLMRHEWASCADDILWRRSKLGLHLPAGAARKIEHWIAERAAPARSPTESTP